VSLTHLSRPSDPLPTADPVRCGWTLRPSWLRQALVLAFDGTIAACSLWFAMFLRFEGSVGEPYITTLAAFTFLLVACRILGSFVCRLHQWSFRFSGLTDAARVGLGGLIGTGLFTATIFLMRHPGPPRSVLVLELLLSSLLMVGVRFSPRLAGMYVRDWVRSSRANCLRTAIVGAGAAGEMLLRDLQRSQCHSYQVIGFVDDDRSKWNQIVGGRTVLGGIDDLPRLAFAHRIEQLLIAVPRLPAKRVREILSLCSNLKLRFKILPVSFVYLQKQVPASMMQDLSTEDLLQREAVVFDEDQTSTPVSRRSALVTGGGGSIGSEICRQLLHAGLPRLVMVDINENELYLWKRRLTRDYPDAEIAIEVADIRDSARMRAIFRRYRPQDVFHAAAHKHVPLLEAAPCEAVKNNVLGTRNVAEAALERKAERFLYISTDKAVRPTSVMGATKRVGEELVRALACDSTTKFCAVRFGNVLGSAGSVVPIFREQIAVGGPVTVTDPEVRRYFMTVSEAVALVLRAAYSDYGELCVLDMGEQIKIVDLARHMITLAGFVPDVDVPITFTGLRPGEKMYEELLTEEEERTRKVNQKILVAECPPPHRDLGRGVRELVAAALAEDDGLVVDLLRALVPSYEPSSEHGADRAHAAAAAS